MAPKVDKVDSLKNSLRAYKGHLTITLDVADNLVHLADANPTPALVGKLEATLSKLEGLNDQITELHKKLQEEDPTKFDDYKDSMEECVNRFKDGFNDIMKMIITCKQAGVNPHAQLQQPPPPQGQQGRLKTNDALKPFKLTKDHTPVEMRQWTLQFKAFYSTSRLDTLAITDQQAYLRICMDPQLYERFQGKIGANTPLFSDDDDEDTCIGFLEEEFALQYPLFTRRLEFFRSSQSRGQNFSDFLTQLDAKADEADLAHLDTADVYVFRYIVACTDQKLKEKLLKLENPTREEIKRTTRAYEVTMTNMKAFEVSSAKANKVSPKKKGNRQSGNQTPNKKKFQIPSFLKGKCIRCADQGHRAPDCPLKAKTCGHCKKDGHVKRACMSLSRANSKANSRAVSADTSRAPSPSPPSTQSTPAATSRAVTRHTKSKPTPRVQIDYQVGQKIFSFPSLPDTGTTRTIISSSLLSKHAIPVHNPPDEDLFAANEVEMACTGSIIVKASLDGGPQVEIDCLVSSDLPHDILISWHDLQKLKILS